MQQLFSFFVSSALVLLLVPITTSAQVGGAGNSFITPELALELTPAFPRPGQEVEVVLSDYGSGTFGSAITWRYNGVSIPDTENRRSIVVFAGGLGTTATLEAVLTAPSGAQQVARATVKPLYIDIVIEPQTYTPHFYNGRAVPSINSVVNATALLNNGSALGGSDHFYTWQIGQTVIDGGPLRGAQQVTFEMPLGQSSVLSLSVKDARGNTVGRRSILVPSITPKVSFYEVSSLYGVSTRALDTTGSPLVGSSATLRAVPYFLDTRTYNNPDVLEWSLGGRTVTNSSNNPYIITLQGATQGTNTNVELHVRSLTQILQGAQNSITISY